MVCPLFFMPVFRQILDINKDFRKIALATGYWLLATGYWLLATGGRPHHRLHSIFLTHSILSSNFRPRETRHVRVQGGFLHKCAQLQQTCGGGNVNVDTA